MANERLYNFCYGTLRFFHWGLFFIVVEIMFWFAGWMIFGLMENVLAWLIDFVQPNADRKILHFLPTIGNYAGLIAGIFLTKFVLGRYAKSAR